MKTSLLLITTIIVFLTAAEIVNYEAFYKIITSKNVVDYASWFLGLGVGMIIPWFFRNFEKAIVEKGDFLLFVAIVFVLGFAIALAKGVAMFLLSKFIKYSHLIFVQWLIFVYIYFKISNKHEVAKEDIKILELLIAACVIAIAIF